jgi:hypothetical protein
MPSIIQQKNGVKVANGFGMSISPNVLGGLKVFYGLLR